MTSDLAIDVRNLRKVYRVYANPAGQAIEFLTRRQRHTERVALDNVTIEVHRGEVVGILGRNGAGKSTLLKLIAGTMEPTSGAVDIKGRITAILELGTGFHPEYTGRENIYMGGLCLGMTRSEIDAKLDHIIDFAELRDVIDQPFKTYSTGMQARLTFSTAISVAPDILIVDEALSVGDARFQMKCFSWIKKLKEGCGTILLVSHDANTITTFCDRALILEGGRVFAEGAAKAMTILYHNLLFGRTDPAPPAATDATTANDVEQEEQKPAEVEKEALQATETKMPDQYVRYGSGEAELIDWALLDDERKRINLIESGKRCSLILTLACRTEILDLSAGFAIKDRKGTVVWGLTNITHNKTSYHCRAGDVIELTTHCTMWLAAGSYFVTLGAAHLEDGSKIDFVEDAIEFRVLGPDKIFSTSTVNLDSDLLITRKNEEEPA